MIRIDLNEDQRAQADGYVVDVMAHRLMERGVDLSDMEAVRDALVAEHFGDRLIAHCAERAVVKAKEFQHA